MSIHTSSYSGHYMPNLPQNGRVQAMDNQTYQPMYQSPVRLPPIENNVPITQPAIGRSLPNNARYPISTVIPPIQVGRNHGAFYPNKIGPNDEPPVDYAGGKALTQCQKTVIFVVVITVIIAIAGCGLAAWLNLSDSDSEDDDRYKRPQIRTTATTLYSSSVLPTEDEMSEITMHTQTVISSKPTTPKQSRAVSSSTSQQPTTTKSTSVKTTATTTPKPTSTTVTKTTTPMKTTVTTSATTTTFKPTTTVTKTTIPITTTVTASTTTTTLKPTTATVAKTTTPVPTTTTVIASTTKTTLKPTTTLTKTTTPIPTTTTVTASTTLKPTTTVTKTTTPIPTTATVTASTTTLKPTTTVAKSTTPMTITVTATTPTTTLKPTTTVTKTTTPKPITTITASTATTTLLKPATTVTKTTTLTPMTTTVTTTTKSTTVSDLPSSTTTQNPNISNSTNGSSTTLTSALTTTTITKPGCAASQFRCNDGTCIREVLRCDAFTDCPDWSDETSCDCAKQGKFQCANKLCVFPSWKCDGANDCKDNSDETNCPCTTGFECLDSKVCLLSSKRCNNFEECLDGSDEHNCTCPSQEKACANGKCILREWFCDGSVDCDGGDDETNCSSCAVNQFNCANHEKCISTSKRCDMVNDCSDGSDERNCANIIVKDNVLTVVLEGTKRVPVCSVNWNNNWNEFVCNKTGAGTLVSTTTVNSSSVTQSSNGYALPQGGNPTNNILEVLSTTTSSSCSSGQVVSITCSFDVCGTRARQFQPVPSPAKILQGYTAQPGHWPWQVALFYDKVFTCGATVISPEWIITAAHCVEMAPSQPNRFRLIVGSNDKGQVVGTQQGAIAKAIHMHSGYNDVTLENDIALIQLDTKLTYTDYVRPACRPIISNQSFTDSIECYITGWGGLDKYASSYPDLLQEAKMHLIDDNTCANHPDIKKYGLYNDIMLCAGYAHGHITVCRGDSGGPLVCRGKNNIWTLAGVVSWGPVTATIKCMGISVFTEVSAYLDWITNVSGVS